MIVVTHIVTKMNELFLFSAWKSWLLCGCTHVSCGTCLLLATYLEISLRTHILRYRLESRLLTLHRSNRNDDRVKYWIPFVISQLFLYHTFSLNMKCRRFSGVTRNVLRHSWVLSNTRNELWPIDVTHPQGKIHLCDWCFAVFKNSSHMLIIPILFNSSLMAGVRLDL